MERVQGQSSSKSSQTGQIKIYWVLRTEVLKINIFIRRQIVWKSLPVGNVEKSDLKVEGSSKVTNGTGKNRH